MNDLLQGISIFLIGMMGTGKTTVGELLAQQLKYRFFDTDALIEQITGLNINEIFNKEGEQGFRNLETKILAELSAYTRCAIATGGGIVLRQHNWSYLHYGLVVWLDAKEEILVKRLTNDTIRPLLKEVDPVQKLKTLLHERRPLYQQADLRVEIEDGQTPEEIALKIIQMMPTVLKPKPIPPV
jgi:shikimate kinase